MNPIQIALLIAVVILSIAVLVSFGSLAYAYWNFRKERTAERSLLRRLEDVSNQTKLQAPPRKKYFIDWSH